MDQVKKSSFIVLVLMLVTCRVQEPTLTVAVPSSSLLPSPSETSMPTLTASLAPTGTSTPAPLPTSTPPPFPWPDSFTVWKYDISPNGEWIAWVGSELGDGHSAMLVENLIGDKSWLVAWPDEKHKEICTVNCNFLPTVWSADGRFLFFYLTRDWDAGINSDPAVAVMKLSLNSGQSSYLLPPRQNEIYYFSFSPNAERLVYTLLNDPRVTFTLVDLLTGGSETFTINVEFEYMGILRWSPYDDLFCFQVYQNDLTQTELYAVDIQDFSFKKIYSGEANWYDYKWHSPTEILLIPASIDQPSLIINIQTGEITPVGDTGD